MIVSCDWLGCLGVGCFADYGLPLQVKAEKTSNSDDPKWGMVRNMAVWMTGNAIVTGAGKPEMGDRREKTGGKSRSVPRPS